MTPIHYQKCGVITETSRPDALHIVIVCSSGPLQDINLQGLYF